MCHQGILRSFREHHIDPTAITRHDFYETNGNNFAVTMPVLAGMAYQMLTRSNEQIAVSYNSYMFVFLLAVLISMTNQVRDRIDFLFYLKLKMQVTHLKIV